MRAAAAQNMPRQTAAWACHPVTDARFAASEFTEADGWRLLPLSRAAPAAK
jgi:hypothetical protein